MRRVKHNQFHNLVTHRITYEGSNSLHVAVKNNSIKIVLSQYCNGMTAVKVALNNKQRIHVFTCQ